MAIFQTRSDRLAKKLKVRTRQLRTLNELSKLRDSTPDTEEFLQKTCQFITEQLASRFTAIALGNEEISISASTDKAFTAENQELLLSLATNAVREGKEIIINKTRPHPKLRAARVTNVMAVPLQFKGQNIGAVVVFRFRNLPFRHRSRHTIATITDQLPPALDYVAAGESVTQKNKELKIIQEVDEIRDRFGHDLQDLLETLAEQITSATSAKGAFVIQFGKKNKVDKIAASGTGASQKDVLGQFAHEAVEEGEMIHEELEGRMKEGVCIPVTIDDDYAAFGMVNPSNADGFSEEDKRILSVIAQQADSVLLEDKERKRVKDLFSRYVSSEVLELILNDPEQQALKTKRSEITMLFADMRGFTAMSEKNSPEKIVKLLNEYFNILTEIILKHKGTLDKFVGDEIVAIFGAPIYFEDHAKRAVRAAIEMQNAFRKLQRKWKSQGLPTLGLGIGIDSGNVVVGNIGAEQRFDYTAIGDHVNTASRLCSEASDTQVLMTQNAYDQVSRSVRAKALPSIRLKGKAAMVKVYNATSIR